MSSRSSSYKPHVVRRQVCWQACWASARLGRVLVEIRWCGKACVQQLRVPPGRATVTGTLLSPHACEWNTAMQKKGMLTKSRNTCILFVRKCPHVQVGLP